MFLYYVFIFIHSKIAKQSEFKQIIYGLCVKTGGPTGGSSELQ